VTLKVSLALSVTVRVTLAEVVLEVSATLFTLRVTTAVLLPDTKLKFIVPAKPFSAVTVIVLLPATLTVVEMNVGFAAIVKSTTWKVTVAVCDKEPLVPVTTTLLFPAVE